MSLRMLVVTRDPLVQHRLGASLGARGIEVRFAQATNRMADYCRDEHFAAIVVDLDLANLSDATEPLRFCKRRPVVIGLARPGAPSPRIDGAVVPVVLRKSFDWELLSDIVTQAARAWHDSAA